MNVRLCPVWMAALVSILVPVTSPFAALPIQPEITRAAAIGLPVFLSQVPPGEEPDYGFATAEEARRAQLGEPFRLHVVTPTALRTWQPGEDAATLLSETDMWYFPIAVDGVVRSILVVDRTPAGWEAVSLGYAPLAAALQDLMQNESKNGHPLLLAVSFQAREYLFTLPDHPEPNLTLLELSPPGPGRRASTAPRALQSPADAVARLLPAVEKNLAEFGSQTGGAK